MFFGEDDAARTADSPRRRSAPLNETSDAVEWPPSYTERCVVRSEWACGSGKAAFAGGGERRRGFDPQRRFAPTVTTGTVQLSPKLKSKGPDFGPRLLVSRPPAWVGAAVPIMFAQGSLDGGGSPGTSFRMISPVLRTDMVLVEPTSRPTHAMVFGSEVGGEAPYK